MTIEANTTTSNNTSNNFIEKVITGNCSVICMESTTVTDVEGLLDGLLFQEDCTKNETINFSCLEPEKKNSIIHITLKEYLQQGWLANLFNFLGHHIQYKEYILSNKFIEDLISFISHYITLLNSQLVNSESSHNETNVNAHLGLMYLFNQLLRIPNISQFNSTEFIHHRSDDIFQDITPGQQKPIEFLIGKINKLTQTLIVKSDFQHLSIEKKNFHTLLESLGQMGFTIDKKFKPLHGITNITLSKILDTKLPLGTTKDVVVWTYSYQYKDRNVLDTKIACNEFGAPNCHPDITQAFTDLIKWGNNTKLSFAVVKSIEPEIYWNSLYGSLTLEGIARIFILLKNAIKAHSSQIDPKEVYSLTSYQINALKSQVHDRYFSYTVKTLSALLLTLVKSYKDYDSESQIQIINELNQLYLTILQQAPNLQDLLSTLNNNLFSMLARHIDHQGSHLQTTDKVQALIQNLTAICLIDLHCPTYKTAAKSFKILGSLSRKSPNNFNSILDEAKSLSEQIKHKLNPEEVRNIVSHFFKANISQANLDSGCMEYFNLTDCQPAKSIDLDISIGSQNDDIIATTLASLTHATNATTTTPVPATMAINNQTTPTFNHKAVTTESSNNSNLFSNQTLTNSADINNDETLLVNPGLTLGASAVHGVATGMLNGIIQYFAAKYSRHGEHSSTSKAVIIYSSLFTYAAVTSTFPLMLLKIQEHINQGNDEEAQQLWDNMLLQILPTFISTVGLSLGMQILSDFTQLFTHRFYIQTIAKIMVPATGIWANSAKSLIASGVQFFASCAASSAVYLGLNRISPINHRNSDLEMPNGNKSLEMEPLNTEIDVKPIVNGISESEINEKTYQYISENKFKEIKINSETLLDKLKELQNSLIKSIQDNRNNIAPNTPPVIVKQYGEIIGAKKHVLQIIQNQINIMSSHLEFLNDKIHSDADKHHTDKKLYNAAMEKLGNVFKFIVPALNTMKSELNGAKGFIKGKNSSFYEIIDISNIITDIMEFIEIPLSSANIYLKKYSDSDMVERAEKNGAVKALANLSIDNTTTSLVPAISRQPRTNGGLTNRAHSMYSDRTCSSGSDKSDVSGNSEFDPLFEQQQCDLIKPSV